MLTLYGCSEDALVPEPPAEGEGTLLNLYIGDIAAPSTRLAELGGSGNISGGESPTKGPDKKNIGLYIYYEDDYNNGILTRPYVRNLECKVEGGKIIPVDGSSIYIYDRMTIVAFYPYNSNPPDYTFTNKIHEQRYFITEGDYSYQYYIPYRAETKVNPTTAYHISLWLQPVHTSKIQVVLLSSDPTMFPAATTQTDGVVKLVPGIDPVGAATGDKRENWVDVIEQPYGSAPAPASSGLHVQRFSSYVWRNDDNSAPHHGDTTTNHNDNTINKGEVLLQSDKLTLFFPEDITIHEGRIYRYGYNIDTGELFTPTSETLIHDAATLAGAGGGGYQVCDIDLSAHGEWTPIILGGTYDGGGHAVKNMTIKTVPTDKNIGLFGSITGNSLLKNLSLEDPKITIDFSSAAPEDTLHVGGLVGKLNRALTAEELEAIKNSLTVDVPPDLPQSVIDALIAEAMEEFTVNTNSQIEGSKVANPTITVKGDNVIAGGIAGMVGDGEGYKGSIKDSYVFGGSIEVNAESEDVKKTYDNAWVGAFAGSLSNGSITNSYTTASAEAYVKEVSSDDPPVTTSKDVAKGFSTIQEYDKLPTTVSQTVTASFTRDLKEKTEDGVKEFGSDWPTWGLYTGDWPVVASTLSTYWGSLGSTTSTYPLLVWETRLDVK